MDPCLSIKKDNESQRTLTFDLSLTDGQSIVEALQLKPTMETVQVINMTQQPNTKHFMLKLALALKLHPGITAIHFDNCNIGEFSHLCVSTFQKYKLNKFEFDACTFDHQAVETIRFMLENDAIGELSFKHCLFDKQDAKEICAGLYKNQSLNHFEWISYPSKAGKALNGALEFLTTKQNLVKLTLSHTDDKICWGLFRAAKQILSLESLHIAYSEIDLPSMEAIMMMSIMMKSLKELNFKQCTFDQDATEFLMYTLSNNNVLSTLVLDCVSITPVDRPWKSSFGDLQVEKLDLTEVKGCEESFPQMLEKIASNRFIKSLELDAEVLASGQVCQQLCDILLRRNRGPSELVFYEIDSQASILAEALQYNSSVKALTIGCSDDAAFTTIIQCLANMSSLRKLELWFASGNCTEGFFQALQRSLEQNTTLWSLSIDGLSSDHEIVSRYLPKIRCHLAINRVGCGSLFGAVIPVGLWAHVLARSTNDADGIYFVLTGKPDILSPTRKRKVCKLEVMDR